MQPPGDRSEHRYRIIPIIVLLLTLLITVQGCSQKRKEPEPRDLVETIAGDMRLSFFSTALKTTDLIFMLRRNGPYTVFIPTDQAFEEFTDGKTIDLIRDPPALTRIVLRHIVRGKMTIGTLTDRNLIENTLGKKIVFEKTGGGILVGGTWVIAADIETYDGMIHVIDAVLSPPGETTE